MTFGNAWRDYSDGYYYGRVSGNALPQRVFAGAALVCVAFLCAFALWTDLARSGAVQVAEAPPRLPAASIAYARLARALNAHAARSLVANEYAALFDSRHDLGAPPGTFITSAPIEEADAQPATPASSQSARQETQEASSTAASGHRIVQSAALPTPQLQLPPIRNASVGDGAHARRAVAERSADKPTIFEKLFGKSSPLTLAYASPDDGGLGGGHGASTGRYDRWTAVYDISAHTVYMPDGTTLEAHSGLGSRLDDPRHADERNRGATPPDVYDLELREEPFHGVRALRLIPVDDEKVFGRTGLLAHSYMLGPKGDSNGCVSFRNYNAFLQAYIHHEIKRLAVVARLD